MRICKQDMMMAMTKEHHRALRYLAELNGISLSDQIDVTWLEVCERIRMAVQVEYSHGEGERQQQG